MIKHLFYSILEKRHFWRYASFSEIAELYASRTLRVIAMNIVSGFTSVYLYKAGYSLAFIIGFWMCFYFFKIPVSYFGGYFVARFGPKHGILISNLLYVPSMMSLGFMPQLGIVSIVLWGFFMAVSMSVYHICYMVDFSKVKNIEHVGKELAFMNILEKIAIGISPIVGGVIALWFGLQAVIWVAAILFAVSALPLLASIEPVQTRQKLDISGFPWRLTIRSIIAQTGVGFDYVTTGIVWSLFIVIVIFPETGWDIYVKLGILSSVTIIAAVAASYAYGKLIDKSKGGSLLRLSVIANAFVHASRPFAINPAMIVGTNIANEAATMGYTMSFMRGVFDTADISGHRIVYLTISDIVANIGAAIACGLLLAFTIFLGDVQGLQLFFFFAAGFVLLIGTANFRLYSK
jgi:MFS family permease